MDRAIAEFSVRMNSKSPELTALEKEVSASEYELQSLGANGQEHTKIVTERRQILEKRLAEIKPKVRELRDQWNASTAPIQALQTEKSVLDKKLHLLILKQRRLQELRADNTALMAANTDASKTADDIAVTTKMIAAVRTAIHEKDIELGKINLSGVRDHVISSDHIIDTFSNLSGIDAGKLTEDERERILHMEDNMRKKLSGKGKRLLQSPMLFDAIKPN